VLAEVPAEQIETMNKKYFGIVAAVVSVQIAAATGKADETSDAIADLRKQIDVLSGRLQQLETQRASGSQPAALSQSQTEATPPKSPPFITAGENGFTMQSADTNFTLKLHGMGQLDSHYYSSPNPGAKDTFTLRRLRAVASGTVYHDYDYFMQADFGSGFLATTTNNNLLLDAYLDVHYVPEIQLKAGKIRVPVSLEVQPADENLYMVERGYPSELAPNRDVGFMVHGDLFKGALYYGIGAFNGVPDGNSGDIEVADNEKDVAGRVFALPFKNTDIAGLKNFGFGLGASYGFEAGTTTPTYSTMGRQKFFSYATGPGTAASPNVTEAGGHLRLDPQGYYYWGPAGLYWEYIVSSEKFQRDAGAAQTQDWFDSRGWDVTATWYLTGETNGFWTPPAPLHPFRLNGSGLGAWQLVARVQGMSLDSAAFSSGASYAAANSAQNVTTWGIGLNWFMNKNIKWIFEYDQSAFGFEPSAAAPKSGSVTSQNERVFLSRLQFGF
jgi:phosphate-selective porin OprO/OprP